MISFVAEGRELMVKEYQGNFSGNDIFNFLTRVWIIKMDSFFKTH